jgi:hypothetical protein
MGPLSSRSRKRVSLLAGAAVLMLGLWQLDGPGPAKAAPAMTSAVGRAPSLIQRAQLLRRRHPPVYPYSYSPGRRGGWSFYFGFVPYGIGDYETQALQRRFPEMNYPPSMRAWTPQTGF